jgi:hypothetical protein
MDPEEKKLLDKFNREDPTQLTKDDWKIYLILIDKWRLENGFEIINPNLDPIRR